MNIKQIEHLWKQATDCPHHDANWYDPAVVRFANLVYNAGIDEANKRHCEVLRALHDTIALQAKANTLKPRESK